MFKNDGEMTLHLHLDTALHCDIDFGHTWIMMYNDSDCTKWHMKIIYEIFGKMFKIPQIDGEIGHTIHDKWHKSRHLLCNKL